MGFRHEDYPCCGCGSEGCVDDTRTVTCKGCGKKYHPDDQTEVYCYRCQAIHEISLEENENCYEEEGE